MLSEIFRPWGLFPWVFQRVENYEWDLLACLATEERCLGTPYHVEQGIKIRSNQFFEIADPEPIYKKKATKKIQQNKEDLHNFFSQDPNFFVFDLLGSPVLLKTHMIDFITNSAGNVIADISSFPKRYFFPIVKLLFESEKIHNLVITYTIPEKYYSEDLAEEPTPWAHLPMFQRINADSTRKKIRNAVVGVGFLPFGLAELLKGEYQNARVTLIFPFPPGPPNYQRNWEFVRNIETHFPLAHDNQIIRVDAYDTSGCFQHLCALTDNGSHQSIFAPYGPKPHSLAMCLFAIKHDCDVYYTQPRVYHPDYCTGIKCIEHLPVTYAYCLKLKGRKLY
nr:hypothetical protein [Desulfobacula sp.]